MPSILIQLNDKGQVSVQSDIGNVLTMAGLLDLAKRTIFDKPMEKKVDIVPASVLGRLNGVKPS